MTLFFIAAGLLVSWDDVDAALRPLFEREQAGAESFDRFVQRIETGTAQRLREGLADHLVYYVLQSRSFTEAAPIVPALSAKLYHESAMVPDNVRRRIADFTAGVHGAPRAKLLAAQLPANGKAAFLESNYKRAMEFLHEKEFASRTRSGRDRRDYVASLYTARGHSTDTSPNSSQAAIVELEALAAREPGVRFRRVLIVGPGLDLAPRDNLQEDVPPQSYQPATIAKALVAAGLATVGELAVECADINPLVAQAVRADPWNILTRRPPPARYDLVIATNVLLYFPRAELLLAINNIHQMVKPGGYFLHNDTRGEIEEFTAPIRFGPVNARMVRTGQRAGVELYDAAVLHRREK
ncbi:MAG: class I SAM-dependent methyltransferase [Bryobacteraceae bacterium]